MKRVLAFTAIAMLLSVAVVAQQTDTSRTKKPSADQVLIQETVNKLYSEKDGKKAEVFATEIVRNIDTNPLWESEKAKRDLYRMHPLYVYMQAEDFEGAKNLLAKLGEVTVERIHYARAGLARRMVAKGVDLEYAGQITRKEREWARRVMLDTLTSKNFKSRDNGRMFAYALFTMDYAKWLHVKGEKQIAFDLMKEAMEYNRRERKEAELTDYYLTLAADFVPQNELKKEMEALINEGMATAGIINRLKAIYAKEKGSEAGFQNYILALNAGHIKEKMEALRKTMLDTVAPAFRLKDLKGKQVSLKDLKGKTLVLDFWATWCGPCIASFPAMHAMVNRFKDNPDVQFLFIDTWERGENPQKDVANFIARNKYDDFRVLLDSQSEVVKQYKIRGIPAKFVIDKNGVLRFRAAGFANDAELMTELEAMIQLVH